LHKGTMPAETISGIVQGHLKQIVPLYAGRGPAKNPPAN
jgi:hypothetical protein